ncbi:MAG: lysine biosynthesis protein LysX [Anaerolineae bacterium]|nr:lysine biosynthesis protein LysX [Anaerolineae bacterium]
MTLDRKIGILCSRVRIEEKLILEKLRERGIPFDKIDVRDVVFNLQNADWSQYSVVLIRCLSHTKALYAAKALEMQGVKTVNSHSVIEVCGDKILTTLALQERGIPTPPTHIAFSKDAGLAAVDEIGYPAVLKPPVGSWGRLIAKVNDREAAEAVIEHKEMLEAERETPLYIQAYVDKPGRDIRSLVVGSETVYAVYRHADHWITNTARGGQTTSLAVSPEIDRLSRAAAEAVGGGIVAVDLMEDADGRVLVNEVNNTPEFHGAMDSTDVDIAGKMVNYVLEVARS